ncbi:MAG: RNA methyltransferase [Comamonadaceae bacterium]|nr:RNA methyltransferase [Comamonadaceae bacterium]
MNAPTHISSRDNALLKDLRRLATGNTDYRKQGRFWAEGDHLVRAALLRGARPALGAFSESFWPLAPMEYKQAAIKNIVFSEPLYAELSALESPSRMGFVFDLPGPPSLLPQAASVILDRVQDAGNVGAILRSASAFGFRQVIALKGTAALWSPKVLRAGMGAHWGLQLIEGADLALVQQMALPLLVTSSHQGRYLHELLLNQELPAQCVWALGHEGQGVCAALQALASQFVRIAQPGGEESLNVASAAAICLHASATAAMG